MTQLQNIHDNRLLGHLPPEDLAGLAPHLKLVPLVVGAVLHESSVPQAYAYFPTSGTLSLVKMMEDGRCTAVATVGNDGLAGVSLFMGGDRSSCETVVQGAGFAFRVRASIVESESLKCGALQRLAMRYAQAMMTEMAQTAVCNRLHTIEQQLCRWLLLSTYHSESSTIIVTQGLIANTLGTRREAIAEAAARLRTANLIKCGRGRVSILDRPRLVAHACECYATAKKEVDRLLPYRTSVRTESTATIAIENRYGPEQMDVRIGSSNERTNPSALC